MRALPLVLRICLPLPWSPPFPLHALALILLFLAKVRLSPTLILSLLMFWYSEQTALFLLLLARAAPAFLPTALSVALRPLFPFRQVQYVQVIPLKPAPFCTLFAGFGSTNNLALLFSYPTLVLSSSPSFLLSQTLWQIWQELFSLSCSYRLQWVPRHSFLPGNDSAHELARRGAPLAPSAIPCSLSPLIHSCLFSDWRRTVSSKFFDTQVPSISSEELVLPRHARWVLSSSLQRTQPSFRFLSLLDWQNRESFLQRLWTLVPGHISFCTAQLRTLCAANFLATLCLCTTSGPDPGELPGFWGSMVFRHAPSPRKGSGNQQQQQQIFYCCTIGQLAKKLHTPALQLRNVCICAKSFALCEIHLIFYHKIR